MEYYSEMKPLLMCTTMWMNIKIIILSKSPDLKKKGILYNSIYIEF